MASAPAWLGTRSEAAGAASVGGASRALGPAAGALAGRVQPERRHVSAPLQRKASEGSPLGSGHQDRTPPGSSAPQPGTSPQPRRPGALPGTLSAVPSAGTPRSRRSPTSIDPLWEVGQMGPWAKLVRFGRASPKAYGSAATCPLGCAAHSLLPRGAQPACRHGTSPGLLIRTECPRGLPPSLSL